MRNKIGWRLVKISFGLVKVGNFALLIIFLYFCLIFNARRCTCQVRGGAGGLIKRKTLETLKMSYDYVGQPTH